MRILLSAHLDRIIQDYNIEYRRGFHRGLLDNFIGILATYLALYDDRNIHDLEIQGKLLVWHGKAEEWGILKNAPVMGKHDIAVIVDVADGKDYRGRDFAIENVSGFTAGQMQEIKETLEWEGLNFRFKKFTGAPMEEDESWQWRKRGIRTLSFTIPITCKDDGWHRVQMDNTVSYEKVRGAVHGLKRLLVCLYDVGDK
jgi:hypothetical protein